MAEKKPLIDPAELERITELITATSAPQANPIGNIPTGWEFKPTATPEERNVVRYGKGDERLPGSYSSREIADLQTRMVQAGLLDDDFVYGVFDDTTEDSYTRLLDYANRTGLPSDEALVAYEAGDQMTIDPLTGRPVTRSGKKGSSKAAPLTIRYSNPNDLAMAANEIARKRIGRAFTSEELNRFVKSYQGEESRAQQASYGMQTGAGGTYVEAPTVETAADLAAKQADPKAAEAQKIMGYADTINRLISGGAGTQGAAQPGGGA